MVVTQGLDGLEQYRRELPRVGWLVVYDDGGRVVRAVSDGVAVEVWMCTEQRGQLWVGKITVDDAEHLRAEHDGMAFEVWTCPTAPGSVVVWSGHDTDESDGTRCMG